MCVFHNLLKDFFGGVGVSEKFGETDGLRGKAVVGIEDAVVVGIGDDASTSVNNLDPFGLGSENDGGTGEEESLFLHPATVGHHHFGILLQKVDFKE